MIETVHLSSTMRSIRIEYFWKFHNHLLTAFAPMSSLLSEHSTEIKYIYLGGRRSLRMNFFSNGGKHVKF